MVTTMPMPKISVSIRLDRKLIKFFKNYGDGSLVAGIRWAAAVLYSIQQFAETMPTVAVSEALDRAEKLADL